MAKWLYFCLSLHQKERDILSRRLPIFELIIFTSFMPLIDNDFFALIYGLYNSRSPEVRDIWFGVQPSDRSADSITRWLSAMWGSSYPPLIALLCVSGLSSPWFRERRVRACQEGPVLQPVKSCQLLQFGESLTEVASLEHLLLGVDSCLLLSRCHSLGQYDCIIRTLHFQDFDYCSIQTWFLCCFWFIVSLHPQCPRVPNYV